MPTRGSASGAGSASGTGVSAGRTAAPRVVIAVDKFKGSLTAREVADHLTRGLLRARPELQVTSYPMADGGEGTVDAAVAAGFSRRTAIVSGPTGRPVLAAYAVRGSVAVLEMAAASGISVLADGVLAPLAASSRGTGELIREALDAGCREILLGVGGSASTDGGAGMLAALGVRLLDAAGAELPDGGAALNHLARLDLSGLDRRLSAVSVALAADVDNPLLGEQGAAAVYGPQKGASAGDVAVLEGGLARWATVLAAALPGSDVVASSPGAGAAGGVGFAAMAVLGATRRPGVQVVMDLSGCANALFEVDLVITGEGSIDRQTLHGKVVAGIAQAAKAAGVPVVAVCGRLDLAPEEWSAAGLDAVHALTDLEPDVQRCIAEAGPLLEKLAVQLATDFDSLLDSRAR